MPAGGFRDWDEKSLKRSHDSSFKHCGRNVWQSSVREKIKQISGSCHSQRRT